MSGLSLKSLSYGKLLLEFLRWTTHDFTFPERLERVVFPLRLIKQLDYENSIEFFYEILILDKVYILRVIDVLFCKLLSEIFVLVQLVRVFGVGTRPVGFESPKVPQS